MDENDESPFYSSVDLSDFRSIVAKYVKYLIRARWKASPQFLSTDELDKWELNDINDDSHSAAELLEQAAGVLGQINTDFIRRCGSGGVKETDQSTPAGRLIDNVVCLCDADGNISGPTHNSALMRAAKSLRKESASKWIDLVDWERLQSIRDDLDLLPRQKKTRDKDNGPEPHQFLFRRRRDEWEIRYKSDLHVYQDLVGLFYLWHLVQSQGKGLLPTELKSALAKYDAPSEARSAISDSDAHADSQYEAQTSPINRARNDGQILDAEAKERFRKRLNDLEEELVEARRLGGEAGITRLQEEKEWIISELGAATGLSGKGKPFSSDAKRARGAVRIALDRAFDAIEKKDAQLAIHFQQSLERGKAFTYAPAEKVQWVFEEPPATPSVATRRES